MEPIIITDTNLITSTLAYTLTNGDYAVYERVITAGDVLIALPIYALVIIALFTITMGLVKER